jgi:hypothetical protein
MLWLLLKIAAVWTLVSIVFGLAYGQLIRWDRGPDYRARR